MIGFAAGDRGEEVTVPDDPRRPDAAAVARLRNALCGGSHGGPAEERAAALAEELDPGTRRLCQAAEEFHGRAALWAVTGGEALGMRWHPAAGVILAAAGYRPDPTEEWPGAVLPHLEAARARPSARFLYCDRDPALSAIWRRTLRGDPQATAAQATARDPGAILGAAEAAGISGPVSVQLQMGLHWCGPDLARSLVAGYAEAMPGGSSLVLTLGVAGPVPGTGRLGAVYEEVAGAPMYAHSAEDIAGWVADAGLALDADGVTGVRAWPGRGWAARPLSARRKGRVVAAVGLKPL